MEQKRKKKNNCIIYMVKQLSAKQKDMLKKHKVHHTAKHMTQMRKDMKNGKSFYQSHKIAMKKVGK